MAFKNKNKKIIIILTICIMTTLLSILLLTRNLIFKTISANTTLSSQTVSTTVSNEAPMVSIEETENKLLNEFKITPIVDTLSLRAMNIRVGEGKDFPSSSAKTIIALELELKGILDYAKVLGMNAVIIDVTPFAQSIYPSKILPLSNSISSKEGITSDYDLLKWVINEAKARNLKVIADINPLLICPPKGDINIFKAKNEELTTKLEDGSVYYNPSLFEVRDLIEGVAKEIATYDLYGIILEDINYPTKAFNDNLAYSKYGNSLSLEDFRRRNINLIIAKSINAIKTINQSILAGVTSYAIWDIKDNQADGIDIKAEKSSYNDYYADTLKWVKQGYIDFICPKIEWSLENTTYPLKTISKWWGDKVAESGIKIYFSHPAYKVGGKEIGFNSISELSKEYDYLRALAQYSGSFFDSYASLKANKTSTDALSLLFKGLLDFSTISNTLAITEPKNNTTTDIENISIRGVCDNNFPLTMDGKVIKPTAKGAFAVDVILKAGLNTFKFTHKGQTQILNITYKIIVLKDISPTTDLALNGGSSLTVSVTAHKDSVVSGVLNGQTVSFLPSSNENEDANSNNLEFIKYSGVFIMPQATEKILSLGIATVTATYKGFTGVLKTAKISVNAKEIVPIGDYHIAEVTALYAQCRDIAITTHASSPNYYFLPKGTKDYIVSEISDTTKGEDTSLWVLKSGQKVHKSDCKDYFINEPLTNDISLISVAQTTKATIITFEGCKNAPYTAKFDIKYANEKTLDFSTNFEATTFEIILYNVSTPTDISDFSSLVLNSAIKTKIDETIYKFTFPLKTKGKFYGFKVDYNANGDMYLKINNPIVLSSNVDKPLTGIKIMIDAGHGGIDSGAVHPSSYGNNAPNEKDLNLIVSKNLKIKLIELGADVIMIRDEDQTVDNLQRVIKAWQEQPDIYISIHHDSTTSSNTKGPSSIYYYGYNSNLAKSIENSIRNAYMYSTTDRTKYNTGNPPLVLRNQQPMAVLIECGFMSNPTEYEWLCASETAPKIAKAIADGLITYFKS